jgi:hypothetical protein
VAVLSLLPPALPAQEAAAFTVVRQGDTVAVERFVLEPHSLVGSLTRAGARDARERLRYRVTLLEDGSAPLLELSAWRAEDPEQMPARQTTRVIFRDDSVAVDEVDRLTGLRTMIFPTTAGAVPYLHLSTAFLERATRRAAATGQDSLDLPFFNLGGGQTVTGTVRQLGGDSALVRLGAVEFRFRTDATGRILGGTLPAQGLLIAREPVP